MTSSARRGPPVFIDRDGVICENRSDYVTDWSAFSFIPGAIEALASLRLAGHRVFIVTNQSAVARGLLSRRGLDQIHERMLDAIEGSGGRIEAVLVCPHHPDDACDCRKPEPGLLLRAAEEGKFDPRTAYLVGDHRTDIEAGARAGCRTVLVRTGRGATIADAADAWTYPPDFVADDLVDAVIWILADSAARATPGVHTLPGAEVNGR